MSMKIGPMTPPLTGGTEGPRQLTPLSEQDRKNAAAALQQAMAGGGSQKLKDALSSLPPEAQQAYDKLTPEEKRAMSEGESRQGPDHVQQMLTDMIKKM